MSRRSGALSHRANLAAPSSSAAGAQSSPFQATRSSSDNSEATENAHGFLGGNVNATIDTAEYKDTVLFLAQQQRLQHQEMMEMMRSVLGAVAGGGNAATATGSSVPLQSPVYGSGGVQQQQFHDEGSAGHDDGMAGRRGWPQQQAASPAPPYAVSGQSNLDHNASRLRSVVGAPGTNPRQLADGSVGLHGSYASTQAGWFRSQNSQDTELQAAKARIAQLEAHVSLLEAQVRSKDETIRAMTETNIASLSSLSKKISSTGAASGAESIFQSPVASGAVVSSSSRLANLHQTAAENLNQEIASALNTRGGGAASRGAGVTNASLSSLDGTPLWQSPTEGANRTGGGGSSNLSSPALRQLLERHQQRCQQLLA